MRLPVSLRVVVLFSALIGLPLLALPVVARWIDGRLNRPPPANLGGGSLAEPLQQVVPAVVAERVSPAVFEAEDALAASDVLRPAGLDVAAPPPLAPVEGFQPWSVPHRSADAAEVTLDETTLARLQQIRQRLEEYGADYVIVETLDGSGRYRFHCRMIVDPKSSFTRPFEATAGDPLAAGEAVLREVEAWRTAAVENAAKRG